MVMEISTKKQQYLFDRLIGACITIGIFPYRMAMKCN